MNPLRVGALTPYADSSRPHIDSIKFYRQGTNNQLVGVLDGKVDVLSVASDPRTDSTGHSAGGNCSVYRIGYQVKDTLGNIVKPLWEKIKFDTIPSPPNASQLYLTYGSGSTLSHFRYWVSNDPFNPDSTLRNWYWNTKQKLGEPDSVDADSIEDAKFKDGKYWVKSIIPTDDQGDVPLNQHINIGDFLGMKFSNIDFCRHSIIIFRHLGIWDFRYLLKEKV